MTRSVLPAAAFVVLMLAVPIATAQDRAALVEEGRTTFARVGCSNCHTLNGVGTPVAVDLSRVGAKHDIVYLERWLRDPREVRPSGHMPALELTDADIRALAAYLAAQR
jgi:mono/diheme cytochrome c family protein